MMLDPMPRVFYVPGVGLFGAGATAKQARIATDIAEATIDVITKAEGTEAFEPLSEADLFDVEYWSLEQAKLAKNVEKPLTRQVAVVTGAASGLGLAIAEAMRAEGAEVALIDIAEEPLRAAAKRLGGLAIPWISPIPRPSRPHSPRWRRHMGASTFWCRMRARRFRAPWSRSTTK